MKKNFIFLLLVFLVVSLTSCAGKSNYKKCEEHLLKHLDNDSSYICEYAMGYEEDDVYAYQIYYRVKDSDGHYGLGEKEYFIIFADGHIECGSCAKNSITPMKIYYDMCVSGKLVYDYERE